MKDERDFSEDIKINKYKLENDCEKHPGLYHYYADKLADAKSDLNDAKDKLDFISSETEIFIRNNWSEKDGKMTEAGVKAALEMNMKIQKQKEIIRGHQRSLNTYQAAVNAMDHRKSELDNLVTLLVKGFYSAPNGGRNESVNDQAGREIRKNINSKKER